MTLRKDGQVCSLVAVFLLIIFSECIDFRPIFPSFPYDETAGNNNLVVVDILSNTISLYHVICKIANVPCCLQQVLMPGSTILLPLLFRRSAVVKFQTTKRTT